MISQAGIPEKKEAAAKAPKPLAKIDEDPWSLGDKSVRKDWTQTKNPPLALFA